MATHRICLLCVLLLGAAFVNTADAADVIVGGSSGWVIPTTFTYDSWSSSNQVTVGDTLVFNYNQESHDVAIFPDATAYAACDFSAVKTLSYVGTGSTYTINSTTPVYFGCSIGNGAHCRGGQKVNITALAATAAPSPPTAGSTTNSSAYKAVICWSTMLGVGCVPSNYSTASYATTTFSPGSTVAFNFTTIYHDLYTLPNQAAYDACDFSNGTVVVPFNSNTTGFALYPVTLTAPVTYFSCSVGSGGHCNKGQKVILRTSSASINGTSPATPTTPTTPVNSPPVAANIKNSPPPPSSASKIVPTAAVMAFTILLGLHLL